MRGLRMTLVLGVTEHAMHSLIQTAIKIFDRPSPRSSDSTLMPRSEKLAGPYLHRAAPRRAARGPK